MAEVCLDTKISNAKRCGYCNEPLTQRRSTRQFCSDSHRVEAFRARQREARKRYLAASRSAISLTFDGRTNGQLRCAGLDVVGPRKLSRAVGSNTTSAEEFERRLTDRVKLTRELTKSKELKKAMEWVRKSVAEMENA